ncbi:hypothetical protein BDZ90DRAFT_229582 [Jaminaea rosea]|uniref:Uncharacterized protein n=1 Tax=Jaminaea rosea TaxID=1569628 RepID=A0A316UZ53_9BASI|nr:hypothetical protein BDZ90DRAFT_229582 [Jaminaea rosea]PWN30566.1 hypothetical protein BDZ90DRAFT_229582 [Jaminaea rosea]
MLDVGLGVARSARLLSTRAMSLNQLDHRNISSLIGTAAKTASLPTATLRRPVYQALPRQRHFSSSSSRLNTPLPPEEAFRPAATTSSAPQAPLATYLGPMSRTFYRLKLFSMTSLLFASSLTPVFLFAPAEGVTLAARCGIVAMALGTSGVSTALVAWIGKPYVGRMALRKGEKGQAMIEANNLSWRLRPFQTTIYRPSFIRPTSRPFANWELPEEPGAVDDLQAILADSSSGSESGARRFLIAETKDLKTDRVVGSWWGQVDDAGQVKCTGQGKPVRHFQVHEELLGDEWRILN